MNLKFFPVSLGTKQPALPGDWRLHATDDEAQADAWVAQGYALGLDCEASGLTVIDIDGAVGETTWAALLAANGLPPHTYEHRTPRGGRHLFYEGEAPSTVQKLGEKVDTRGRGGYVVFEGPGYEIIRDTPFASLPEWIPATLARVKDRAQEAGVDTLDLPDNIARAARFAQDAKPAVEGEGGDAHTFVVACKMRDLGVSPETATELLLEHWNPRCDPPWDDDEIAQKVSNAWEYGENEPGAWGVRPAAETFAGFLDSYQQDSGRPDSPALTFKAYDEQEQDNLREPQWLIPDLLPDKSLVFLYGQPDAYKSFLALDIALTLASGIPGWGCDARSQMEVAYVAGEGPRSIARIRRPAWRIAKEVEGPLPFRLIDQMPAAWQPDTIDLFLQDLDRQKVTPKLLVIDTWARFVLGLNENDAKDAGLAIGALDKLRRALDCTVLVIHHSGKNAGEGMRGSSAIMGAADAAHEAIPHHASRTVEVHNRRQKDADRRGEPWLLEGHELAGSLVFQPITREHHRNLTAPVDTISPRQVMATLASQRAVGAERAVTTYVLASSLFQRDPEHRNTPADAVIEGVRALERKLKAAARGHLEHLAVRNSRGELTWCLPATDA